MSSTTRNSQLAIRNPFDPYHLLLCVAMIVYIVIFSQLAFDLHHHLRTHRSDLGQVAQAVWNSSQGRFVEMTDNGFVATRMTDHVEPILALISPVFWFWTDVRALLLLQVVLVACGAWPLYLLAIRRLDTLLTARERTQIWQMEPLRQMTRPLALAIAVAYLLAPQLQSAVLTEFHAVPLAVPLILWAFWAVDAERPWQFAVATLLVAVTKEEMALLAAGLAAWALWRHWLQSRLRQPEIGVGPKDRAVQVTVPAALFILSLLWFYLATFVIVPAHAAQVYGTEESIYFKRYGALGDSPLDIAKSFVTHPQQVWQIIMEPARRAYLWGLLAPFGLLSLLAPEVLLLALPLLLANLLSAYPAQYYGDFHYSAPLVPYMAVSAVYGLARVWRWSGRRTVGTSANYQHMAAAGTGVMALVSLLTNARTALRPLITAILTLWLLTWATICYLDAGRGPWAARYDPVIDPVVRQEHHRLLPYFIAQIPIDAAVTATAAVHPHLSLRRYVYQFPLGLPELQSAGNAAWALLDVTTNTDMAPGDLKGAVDIMLEGEWGVVDGADGFLLLRRGAMAKTIPDPFYDFARSNLPTTPPATSPVSTRPQPTSSQSTSPPDLSRLHRVHVADWSRWRQTKVSAEWLVGADVQTTGFTPTLTLVTPDGSVLQDLTTAAPPALVWYPPARWQPGETVRITTLPLQLPPIWGVVTAGETAESTPVIATGLLAATEHQQTLVDAFQRTAHGVVKLSLPAGSPPVKTMVALNRLSVRYLNHGHDPGQLDPGQNSDKYNDTSGVGNSTDLTLQTWGRPQNLWPGSTFLLWLRWSGKMWPAGKTVFVHLRADGNNIVQRDGLPRLFVYADPATQLTTRGVIDDSRQLTLPTDLPVGTTLSLVVGLYDMESGERSPVVDLHGQPLGEEWEVANFTVGKPPVPDQACALLPDSCTAQ